MRIILAIIALIPMLTPATTSASTFLDSLYGTPMDAGNARSMAMGSVGVSTLLGSSAALQNPALLALHSGGFTLDGQVGIQQVNEDRLVPLFDTFGSFVAETTFAVNRNTYGFGNGGAIFRVPTETPLAISTGIYERYDYGFDYFEEVRDPDPAFEDGGFRDEIIQFHEIQTGGQLRSWTTGLGTEVLAGVNLGVSVHRLFGTNDSVRRVAPVGGTPTTDRFKRELSGWGFSVGAQTTVYDRYSLGVGLEAPATLKGDHTFITSGTPDPDDPAPGEYELRYPPAVNLGGTYTPTNELQTTVTVQATRRFWKDLEDGYFDAAQTSPELRDTWDIRFGVEHIFYNGTPLRFGFRHLESYLDEEVYRSMFSLGVGHMVGDTHIDFAAQYHRQSSNQVYLFDPSVGEFTGAAMINEVQDAVVSFTVGVSREI